MPTKTTYVFEFPVGATVSGKPRVFASMGPPVSPKAIDVESDIVKAANDSLAECIVSTPAINRRRVEVSVDETALTAFRGRLSGGVLKGYRIETRRRRG